MTLTRQTRCSLVTSLLLALFSAGAAWGAAPATAKRPASQVKTKSIKKTPVRRVVARKSTTTALKARRTASKRKRPVRRARSRGNSRFVAGGPWLEPTFADSTLGDHIDGEDLTVRRAAVEALGPYNGSVVVADPETGRVLTIVNQKLAFKSGFQPCSTVKIVAALAGLNEGIIDRDTPVRLYGRTTMNLTEALARSNNPYFANIGVRLGYDKIAYYARLYGFGEKAGLNIVQEQPGALVGAPPKNGGMGMMTSFGEGIKLTPLQLTAVLSTVANGGTLYYLQYPRTQGEVKDFVPQVKRKIPMRDLVSAITPGMLGATEFGTARRAYYDQSEPIFGKTGTCTDRDSPTHLGWFGSFNEIAGRKLVVVVLLTGGRPVNGPVASGIAGQIYQTLSQQRFYARETAAIPAMSLISLPSF